MRFAPRFSRARVRTASAAARPHVQDVRPVGGPPPKTLFFHGKQRFAWRDKVRFLGFAEKHVVRELLCKQKLFGAPAELRECKEVIIFCTSILCPQNCPGHDYCTPVFLLTQEYTKMIRFPCPPWNHQNGTFSVGRAATEPTTTMAHGHVREKNAKQNAPRAIWRSNWRSVVRFVSRFSRARVRTTSVPARPHVQTGPRQEGYPPFRALQLWRL